MLQHQFMNSVVRQHISQKDDEKWKRLGICTRKHKKDFQAVAHKRRTQCFSYALRLGFEDFQAVAHKRRTGFFSYALRLGSLPLCLPSAISWSTCVCICNGQWSPEIFRCICSLISHRNWHCFWDRGYHLRFTWRCCKYPNLTSNGSITVNGELYRI
jgi:hypothetical protein